jgi:hypothetical protein
MQNVVHLCNAVIPTGSLITGEGVHYESTDGRCRKSFGIHAIILDSLTRCGFSTTRSVLWNGREGWLLIESPTPNSLTYRGYPMNPIMIGELPLSQHFYEFMDEPERPFLEGSLSRKCPCVNYARACSHMIHTLHLS